MTNVLPKAKLSNKGAKIGNVVVKPLKPTESAKETIKSIEALEKAVKEKVFIKNACFAAA